MAPAAAAAAAAGGGRGGGAHDDDENNGSNKNASAAAAAAADAFLTALESKLRQPFSSVEVPKAISDAASIRLLQQVLSRAQKVTQLTVLTGLLGMVVVEDDDDRHRDDDDDAAAVEAATVNKDPEKDDIRSIITMAQQAPEYEEWVRVIAGIVQGVMYSNNSNTNNNNGGGGDEQQQQQQQQQRPAGEEATQMLASTCREIIDKVRSVQRDTAVVDEDADFLLQQDDIDPMFAPYWQSLLNKPLSPPHQSLLLGGNHHHHFVVNETADILHLDDKIEEAKSKEEAAHDQNLTAVRGTTTGPHHGTTGNGSSSSSATKLKAAVTGKTAVVAAPATAHFPGFRSTSTAAKNKPAVVQRPKSSLFIPSKKPVTARHTAGKGGAAGKTAVAATTTGDAGAANNNTNKTLIRKRKPGAAQALLAKGRKGAAGRAGTGAATAVSRMKMIDVTESKEKLEEQQQQHLLLNSKSSTGPGRKRALPPPLAAASPETKKSKNAPATTEQPHSSLASPPHQQQQQQLPLRKVEDWRTILAEHCNKITDADRERVRQFFEDRVNPTPHDPRLAQNNHVYRLKLHEEQSVEEAGTTVKVTYYLNLDYTNFTSKQTKKRKEYK
jgi:hypothetical protein